MENVIEELNGFVHSFQNDESLTALLRNQVNSLSENSLGSSKKYFIVTDLCNPSCTYSKFMNPGIKKSPQLARKLLKGKNLHHISSRWFKALKDFVVYEGKIDGVWVGLDGVRGAIDYLIGESILEFKTKNNLPKNKEDIINLFPQDLEQLVFYAAIHPSNPPINYLVFMKDEEPFDFITFKIVVKDMDKIKDLIRDRIKKVSNAIEEKDPSRLGVCRYHDNGCPYCEADLCNCHKSQPLSTEILEDAISISHDVEFTKKLEEAREDTIFQDTIFTTKDIIAPREYYKEKIDGVASLWTPDNKREEYMVCLRNLVEKLPIELSLAEKQEIKNSLKEPKLKIGFRWAKLKTSQKQEAQIIPYLIKVSKNRNMNFASSPNEYHLAELAIITSVYGKERGLIFVVYPYLNDLIKVFDVQYKNGREILKNIKIIIDKIEDAENREDPSQLPETPEFMRND